MSRVVPYAPRSPAGAKVLIMTQATGAAAAHHRHSTPDSRGRMPPPPARKIPAKSPMSQMVDTIIGAAELVDRQEQQKGRSSRKRSSKKTAKVLSKASSSVLSFNICSNDPLQKQLEDEEFVRELVLSMALQRPRLGNREPHPPKKTMSHFIEEGFYWKDYPIVEDVLYTHMEEYYYWSSKERQSKNQQGFNNALVEKCRLVAASTGAKFCPNHFTDKRLRDRIRCFYKTHLQNAKKRLNTIAKHLDRQDNRDLLQEIMEEARNRTPSTRPRLVSACDEEEDGIREEGPDAKRACVRN